MRSKRGLGRHGAGIAAAVLAAALGACAGPWGSYRWDAGVARDFEAARVLPGHRYYTTGSEGTPDAILALSADRPLRNDRWREVAATPETLARLSDRMRGTRTARPEGRVLLGARGEPIGAWYSYAAPTPPRLLDDGGVDVAPPPPATGRPPFPPGRRGD